MAFSPENTARLASQGRVDEAAELLIRAADANDADALFMLAAWRIHGAFIRRDLAEARDLLNRASKSGRLEAARLHAYFLANGTGGKAQWGRARAILSSLAAHAPQLREQLDLAAVQPVDENGDPTSLVAKVQLSEAPGVWTAHAFATARECDYLIEQAAPYLQPSMVADRASGRTIAHPDRKCETMLFGVAAEDLPISAIRRRIAAFAGVSATQTEALQIIRYRSGDEFRPHHDSVARGENQRILTALVYLTDDYEGGETHFLRTGLTFRGGRGDILLFRNSSDGESPDPMAEHAGLPVRSGTKIVLSCWIRARPFAFPPPRPASRRF
jgi:prolyl 4-hydroxylase